MKTIVASLLLGIAYSQGPSADLITNLPGLTWNTNYNQYSGYLDLDNGHHLHYFFVESQNDPSTDPVVLWMNGGPGCSSLDGLTYENGPWHLNDDGSLFENPYAWNLVANVIYLESPVGVGFSYSDDGNYQMSDNTTADDAYYALAAFFERFADYDGREFYVTGESYGGVYVPTLTLRILQGNANGDAAPINLQGFAVGNGLSSDELNDDSSVWFAYNHGLVSEETWNNLMSNCCTEPYTRQNCPFSSAGGIGCEAAYLTVMDMIYESGLNWYNVYGDCETTIDGNKKPITISHEKYYRTLKNIHKTYHKKTLNKQLKGLKIGEDVPCIDSTGANIYFNNITVQEAIHVRTNLSWDWSICSDVLQYTENYDTMMGVYQEIFSLSSTIYSTIYNGDTDLACNFLGDEWFIDDLLGVTNGNTYRTWTLDNDDQIAGWTRDWDRISFVTVRGAGHMVPQWRPQQALKMFEYFLAHKQL